GQAPGNLVSGNTSFGIAIINTGTSNNVVTGNLVGLNAAGNAALGNSFGIFLQDSSNNRIGTDSDGVNDAQERNVVSGNAPGDGVNFNHAFNNLVAGNYLGMDITGTFAIPNGDTGLAFYFGSSGNTFGGTTAAARNIISGNTHNGVWIYAAGT